MSLREEWHRQHKERQARFYPPRVIQQAKPVPVFRKVRDFTPEELKWTPIKKGDAVSGDNSADAAVAPARPKWMDYYEAMPAHAPRYPSIHTIIDRVGQYFSVTPLDIVSQRRQASIVRPRMIAMYLARHLTPRSLPEIGRQFGGRDHTTVLHAVNKIAGLLDNDEGLAGIVSGLREELAIP